MPRGEDRRDGPSADLAHAPTADSGRAPGDSALAPGDHGLGPGDRIGEYVIEAKLGEGGFGTVFKASHPVIGSVTAIKVLKRKYSTEPNVVSRFIAEARAVNEIRHKNIVNIFSFGELSDGRRYYVMEYLEGDTLDRVLRARTRYEVVDALPILRRVARALDAAHAAGVIHRDVKPANVLVAGDEVRLLDFGVAKLATSDTAHETASGTPIGTPRYMSPEQARGRKVDHRSDIYAFGVLAYELLTGVTPFVGDDFMDVVLQQIHDAPPPPSTMCDEVPEALDASVLPILAKLPAERPATACEALDGIERAARTAGLLPASADEVAPSPAPRSTRAWPVAATAVIAGAMVAGGAFMLARDEPAAESAPPPRDVAPAAPAPQRAIGSPPPADAAPAPPRTVAVEIRALQAEARVLDARGTLLRRGPGTIEIPRGRDPVELRFEGDGLEPQTRAIRPTGPMVVVLELEEKPTTRPVRRPPPKRDRPQPAPDKDDIVETF